MADYIPRPDAEFNNWQANFISYLNSHMAELGLSAADLSLLTAAQLQWANTFSALLATQAAANAAIQNKNNARDSFETALRSMVRRMQGLPTVTEAMRAEMNISLRETTRAAAGVPTTRPVASVDTSQRLRHTINFVDEATPTKRSKPDGVMGCEIRVKVGGDAPAGPTGLQFLGIDTRTPYTSEYEGEDAGKIAHYMLRWVNTRGEQGPWSQTVSATIGG
ncbi:MAG: hypothetical protein ICV60_15125 [Pyrinomonadaceae bacterium]|nr:hypothetical protein [Pyrinomonadaceae bacterium]